LAIDMYKATEQYSGNEFPWSFGPLTGTPEQGIDETLALYAGPPAGSAAGNLCVVSGLGC
jgi:hypothetical protein